MTQKLDLHALTPSEVSAALHHPASWYEARRKGIGASDVSMIMKGEWLDLWTQKVTGAFKRLDDIIEVQMGTWTEALNLYWFEKQTGHVVERAKEAVRHPTIPFMFANIDARCGIGPIECKHYGAWVKEDEALERCYDQCQAQIACTGEDSVCLSIFFGNGKWSTFLVERDKDRIALIESKCAEFWGFVERNELPPGKTAPIAQVAIAFDSMREISMEGNNAWSQHAGDWLDNKEPAKIFDDATKELKALVPADVKKAEGHGIVITRNAAGSLSIKAAKPPKKAKE